MARPKKEPTMSDVLSAINQLTEVVSKIVTPIYATTSSGEIKRVDKEGDSTPARSIPADSSSAPQIEMSNGFPIPVEYREIVDTILNKHFKIDIGYLPDQASFEFSILVPRNYSNASEAHWQTYKEDRRSKVIQNAYGANGVREWVTQVRDNFGMETKSAIDYDRAQL